MSITPQALKEMAAGMAEGPLRTAKTIPLADALFDAAERIELLEETLNGLLRWASALAIVGSANSDAWRELDRLTKKARAALAEEKK